MTQGTKRKGSGTHGRGLSYTSCCGATPARFALVLIGASLLTLPFLFGLFKSSGGHPHLGGKLGCKDELSPGKCREIVERGLCRVRNRADMCRRTCGKCSEEKEAGEDAEDTEEGESIEVYTHTGDEASSLIVPKAAVDFVAFPSLPPAPRGATRSPFKMHARPRGCDMAPFSFRTEVSSVGDILRGALAKLDASADLPPCWSGSTVRDQVRRTILRDQLDLIGATSDTAETTCCKALGEIAAPLDVKFQGMSSSIPAESDLAKCLYCVAASSSLRRFMAVNNVGMLHGGAVHVARGLKARPKKAPGLLIGFERSPSKHKAVVRKLAEYPVLAQLLVPHANGGISAALHHAVRSLCIWGAVDLVLFDGTPHHGSGGLQDFDLVLRACQPKHVVLLNVHLESHYYTEDAQMRKSAAWQIYASGYMDHRKLRSVQKHNNRWSTWTWFVKQNR